MKSLPNRPDIAHLKRQAKELLADFRNGAPDAIARIAEALPAAAGRNRRTVARLDLRLHDTQSCIAREYGFLSWADLKTYVDVRRAQDTDPDALATAFCRLVYAGDIAGGMDRPQPNAAARLLADRAELKEAVEKNPWIACAIGSVALVRRKTEADPSWVNRPGGPLNLPPLVAATQSSLLRVTDYRDRLHQTVDLLLAAGADPNQAVGNRWPPASVETPSRDHMLSALYGAAGVNHDPDLTRRLLAAGADPNDKESLYHSLDAPACTRLLLEVGAVVTGTGALYRALDRDDLETLKLLLSHAAGAAELKGGKLLFRAIRRRRSAAHIEALLAAGVDPEARTQDGISAYTLSMRYGLQDVAEVLQRAGVTDGLGDEELFVAACASGDEDAARRIQARRPDLPKMLGEAQLKLLPELAEAGCDGPVALMVDLGWPVNVRGGDWNASALNHAVFRGNGPLARHLLAHGASWTEEHGYDDNVCGTLSWASMNRPVEDGDWVACAEALLDYGMPGALRDPENPDRVVVAGAHKRFSEDVTTFLLEHQAVAST